VLEGKAFFFCLTQSLDELGTPVRSVRTPFPALWLANEKVLFRFAFSTTFPQSLSRIPESTMYWKVTLMRSGIGLSKRRNDTLVALGLRKRFRTVYKPINPQIAGLLLRVKELIRLELVDEIETKEAMKQRRKPEKGYIVESVGTEYVKPVDA
jgi:large subunit ribosomal protein L30